MQISEVIIIVITITDTTPKFTNMVDWLVSRSSLHMMTCHFVPITVPSLAYVQHVIDHHVIVMWVQRIEESYQTIYARKILWSLFGLGLVVVKLIA